MTETVILFRLDRANAAVRYERPRFVADESGHLRAFDDREAAMRWLENSNTMVARAWREGMLPVQLVELDEL